MQKHGLEPISEKVAIDLDTLNKRRNYMKKDWEQKILGTSIRKIYSNQDSMLDGKGDSIGKEKVYIAKFGSK